MFLMRIEDFFGKNILKIKSLWSLQEDNDVTWKLESNLHEVYLHLFTTQLISRTKFLERKE